MPGLAEKMPQEEPGMSLAVAKEWVEDLGKTDPKTLNEKQKGLLAEARRVLERVEKKPEATGAKVIDLATVRARLQQARQPAELPKSAAASVREHVPLGGMSSALKAAELADVAARNKALAEKQTMAKQAVDRSREQRGF